MAGRPRSESDFGDVLSMPDRIVVSPGWGRIVDLVLPEGEPITAGRIVASLAEAGSVVAIRSHLNGVFVRYLCSAGERVPPGRPIALILSR